MKVLYLFLATLLIWFSSTDVTTAQFSATYTSNPLGNWSAPGTWVGGIVPPNPCDNCKIIISSGASIILDVAVQLKGATTPSFLVVQANATLTVNKPLRLDNMTELLVGNDGSSFATLVVNEEVDVLTNSFIRVANDNASVDASNFGTGTGLVNGGANQNGVFYITGMGPVTSDRMLSPLGYKNPFPPPALKMTYTINCGAGHPNPCVQGIVYGPSVTGIAGAPSVHTFVATTVFLPVLLNEFTASIANNQRVDLHWGTSQELNSSYFSVQKSIDGVNFQEIGRVKAKGFSYINTDYSYADLQSLKDINFYRLQMVDLDGQFAYSRIISVSSIEKNTSVVVFNNPFTDQIRLQVNNSTPDKLRFTLTDLLGRICLQETHSTQAGTNLIDLKTSNAISAGLYFLNIKSNSVNKTIKLIKR